MKKLGRNCSVVVYNKIKKERSKCEKVKKKKQKTCNTVQCAKRNYLGSLGFSGQGLI
jgi:hypothetical protein